MPDSQGVAWQSWCGASEHRCLAAALDASSTKSAESSGRRPAGLAGLFASVLHAASSQLALAYSSPRRRADRSDTRKMAAAFARGALRLPAAAPLGLAARPQGAAAAHIARRGASIGLVAARPPLARPQLCATFATTSGDDDDQNRSLDALGDDFFERSRLEDRGNQRATPAGDLQYAGERPGNWEELLAEAEASPYPERAGPRRSKYLARERRRFKNIRRQHYQRKKSAWPPMTETWRAGRGSRRRGAAGTARACPP